MNLFDKEITEIVPPFGRKRYSFVKTNNREYRDILESIFKNYPKSKKSNFVRKFRTKNDEQFKSCCFELITYRNLKTCFKTWVVSEKKHTTPDFYCPEIKTYFEVSVLFNESNYRKRKKETWEELNNIKSDYQFVDFKLSIASGVNKPTKNPRYSVIKKELELLLAGQQSHIILNSEGLRIEFTKKKKVTINQNNITSDFTSNGGAELKKQEEELVKKFIRKIKEKDQKYNLSNKNSKSLGLIILLPDEIQLSSITKEINSLSKKLNSKLLIFYLRGKYHIIEMEQNIYSRKIIKNIEINFKDC